MLNEKMLGIILEKQGLPANYQSVTLHRDSSLLIPSPGLSSTKELCPAPAERDLLIEICRYLSLAPICCDNQSPGQTNIVLALYNYLIILCHLPTPPVHHLSPDHTSPFNTFQGSSESEAFKHKVMLYH